MRALTLPVLLAASLTIQACSTTTRQSTATETAIVGRICKEAWLPISLSHRDTEQTQAEVKAGNRAREAFCE